MNLTEIKLIGIEVRTNNISTSDVGELWKKFYTNRIQDHVPNCIDSRIFVLYSHYETDHTGYFNVLIGSPVGNFENIPQGMVGRLIPAQKYYVKRAEGVLPNAVIDTWQMIWHSDIRRTFKFDFELYDDCTEDTQNAKVDIFIAVT